MIGPRSRSGRVTLGDWNLKTLLLGAAGLAALATAPFAAAADKEAAYELWRSVEDGQTVVAVAEAGKDGAYAVAAGKTDALDVLAGKDAEKAMKDLRARSESMSADIVIADRAADGEEKEIVWTGKKDAKGGKDAPRVVIRKKEIASGDHGEERIVITKAGEDIEIEGDDIEIDDADIEIQDGRRVEIVRVEKRAGGHDASDDDRDDDDRDGHDRSMKKSKKKVILLEGDGEATAGIDGVETLVVELDDAGEGESRFLRIAGAGADAVTDFIDDMDGLDAGEKRALKSAVGL